MEGKGVNSTIRVKADSTEVFARKGEVTGKGGLVKEGAGFLRLATPLQYEGQTIVNAGELRIAESTTLPQTTDVSVNKGATLRLMGKGNEIQSLNGDGKIHMQQGDSILASGLSNNDDEFSGVIEGKGGFKKVGEGTSTFSGDNVYEGTTNIEKGTLKVTGTLGDSTAVSVSSGANYEVDQTDTIGSIAGAGSIEIARGKTLSAGGLNTDTEVSGVISGSGGFSKSGTGTTTLSGGNTYSGATSISEGMLKVQGTLSGSTDVDVASGATYEVDQTDTIGSIAGSGEIKISLGRTLTAGWNNSSTTWSGQILGAGGFTKEGSGQLSISSDNAFNQLGKTTLKTGTIDFGNTSQVINNLVVKDDTKVSNGNLSLRKLMNDGLGSMEILSLSGTSADDQFTNYGTIKITTSANINLKEGNDTFLTSSNLSGTGIVDGGLGDDLIQFGALDDDIHPFKAAKIAGFESAEQIIGSWDYDGDFKASGIETMTLKGGVMEIVDSEHATFKDFVMEGGQIVASLESKNSAPLTADSFDFRVKPQQGDDPYLVIKAADQHDPEGTYTVIDVPAASQGEMNELAAYTQLQYDNTDADFSGIGIENGIEGSAVYDVFLKEGSLQLVVSQKPPEEILDCLENDSCDKDVPSNDNDIVDEITEPGSPGSEIIDGILDDVLDEIDLPIIGYGSLAKLIVSGLAPRNIDGSGRGMATYNNLLADTLFERLPLRQFDPVVIEETVVEEEEVIEEDPAPPVRGLWSKSGEVSDEDAQQALDRAIAQNTDVDVEESTLVERLDLAGFVEDPSLTAQYARRDGIRAWFRAFGGDDRDSYNDNFYNPYYVNSGGGVLGVDVSVSESFQLGAFVNYGNINLTQQSALAGGGSWNPDGWGGGVRADYWTDNFYVQGLFSATGFSGNQRRDIIEITSQLGDETASGTKSATSYGLAFRVGAPFEAGDLLIEPQFTSTWSFNNENRFTESGAGQLNLTYKDRSTTYLQTDLAIKLAYPIKTGDTTELVPSLRVGWLGDWSGNLSSQTIGYRFTDDTVDIKSRNEDTNGVLVEAGLDYTIANINSSSYKVYVRGGIEAWGGTRGTDYRASGGFEWQF